MATYEEIYGKRVKDFDSDPTLDSSYEGQVWYNSATGTLKSVVAFESTSSASSMTTGRVQGGGGGTQTDGFGAGGYTTTNVAITEEYNGTGFSAGGDLTSGRRAMGGTGVTPAGLVFGGYTTTRVGLTEEYNGTSWSESGDLSTTRYAISSANNSPQTAALGFAGYATAASNATEEYNGTSWTAGGNLNVATFDAAGAGTQTSALMCGGSKPGVASNITELYDGSSWTTSGTLNLGRQLNMAFGTQTAAVTLGGLKTFSPDTTTNTIETFNGSTWSTSPATLATARAQAFGIGAPTAGIVFGGTAPGPKLSVAEEYNNSINTITAAAWASGGNLGTSRGFEGSAFPSQTSGLVFGGAPYTGATEEYNGTSWAEQPDLNTARGYMSGFGTTNAAVAVGGYNSPNAPQSLVEEWNGSAWSEETNLPGARKSAGNCGTLTAGLIFGGASAQPYTTNLQTTTFEYDGTNWTSGGALPVAKGMGGSGGTQTAAFYAGGRLASPPPSSTANAEYDGSSWTAGGSLLRQQTLSCLGAIGTLTAGLVTLSDTKTENYDGTSFSTASNYNTARSVAGGGATQTDAVIAGGSLPPYTNHTEELTGATETVTASTLTTS
jgi:hypothetical protein